MAKPTMALIQALRKTAERLENGATYQWTHQGSCNCGHLAQTITRLSRAEIHAYALEKAGDWGEKSIDYCPQSHYPIDHIITEMLEIGLSVKDISHLERLSDKNILKAIHAPQKPLNHRKRVDVILYMRTWAFILEEALLENINLPDFCEPFIEGELVS